MYSGSLPVSFGFIAMCLTKRHQAKKKHQCPLASQTPNDAACDTWFFCWSSYRSWSHMRRESLPPKKEAAKTTIGIITTVNPNWPVSQVSRKKNRHSQLHLSDFSVRSLATSAFDETTEASAASKMHGRSHVFLLQTIWRRNLSLTQTFRNSIYKSWWLFCLDFCWETQRSCIHTVALCFFSIDILDTCVFTSSPRTVEIWVKLRCHEIMTSITPKKPLEMILSSQKNPPKMSVLNPQLSQTLCTSRFLSLSSCRRPFTAGEGYSKPSALAHGTLLILDFVQFKLDTLPETSIAPENGWLEDYFPFGMTYFRGLC